MQQKTGVPESLKMLKINKESRIKRVNHSPAFIVRSVVVMVLTLFPALTFGTEPVSYDDPLESWNRRVFKLNDTLDHYALKPVAKTYHLVTPGWCRP